MARKILTIGITINLENYENLRLEVQGEVGADGNTEELVSFLDGILARLGHGDQATAERVEAYRRRVLAHPGSAVIAAVPDWQAGAGTPAARPAPAGPLPEPAPRSPGPAPAEAKAGQEVPPAREDAPVAPATVRVTPGARQAKPVARPAAGAEATAIPPAEVRTPETRKAPAPAPAPAPQAPREVSKWTPKEVQKEPEKPVLAEGEVACEGCGLAITKNQEKLSRLLTGKSLCKKCMNPP